jgi:hypothetical protein
MNTVTAHDSRRVARLEARLANVEQCLLEARAPDVRAFLYGMLEELQSELEALRIPAEDDVGSPYA